MATAAGQTLGKGDLRLRKKELEGALKEFAALPKEQRTPTIAGSRDRPGAETCRSPSRPPTG